MALERDLIRQIRGLDEHELRRLLIFATGLLDSRTGKGFALRPVRDQEPGRVSYRQQRVRCGKRTCTTCPHGPYWYGYWREGGRLRSRYVGRELLTSAVRWVPPGSPALGPRTGVPEDG